MERKEIVFTWIPAVAWGVLTFMMCLLRIGIVLLIGLFTAHRSAGQDVVSRRYVPVEITLTSDSTYAHPHRDVEVQAVFDSQDGQRIVIAGFWDGGLTYRVRFAPPRVGLWRYRTVASDSSNKGLHHQQGSIEVKPSIATDPFARHGWLRVADNQRYLTYDDGTPFFYLADTAWEITWKSTYDEVRVYVADRKEKGFTAVQLVPMSHLHFWPSGVHNRHGEPFFLDNDFSRLNPRYFAYMDTLIQAINAHGMVAVIVPVWARMTEVHEALNNHRFAFNTDEALLLARYLGARYAGANVLWLLGGDARYENPEQQDFWRAMAETLQKADGHRHLVTIHPAGCRASFDYFDADASWIDFHMYHSGHEIDGICTFNLARRGYRLSEPKPVVNGEPTYEDLYDHLWLHLSDTTQAYRMQAIDIRRSSYESVLTGSFVGIAYGANGIWQWSTEGLPNLFWPRVHAIEALSFPGTTSIGILKEIMERYRWYELEPHPEWVVNNEDLAFLPMAANETRLMAYFPQHLSSATFDLRERASHVVYRWIDPSTGDSTDAVVAEGGLLTLHKPDDMDWLLVARWQPPVADTTAVVEETPEKPPPSPAFFLEGVAPHPFAGDTYLYLKLPEAGTLTVTVWDLLGRRILTVERTVGPGTKAIPLQVRHAGLYLYRTAYRTESGRLYQAGGTMVSIGRH